MKTRNTMSEIIEAARTGEPDAWRTLSGAVGDNHQAREALQELEYYRFRPKVEPNAPAKGFDLSKLPVIRTTIA